MTPEKRAREKIDALLDAAGWKIQNKDKFNRNAALGVALREAGLASGEADYLLFVQGKACGVIEAKPAGKTLSGVAEQSESYLTELPPHLARWGDPLRFGYESTGDETYFRDNADPKPRSRRVFAFHKPETLLGWLQEPDTLRARLTALPPLDPIRLALVPMLRQSILGVAFSGKLVPQDSSEEPASVLLERIAAEHDGNAATPLLERKRRGKRAA